MLRLTNLANKYERRYLRVIYSNTQATPYDATLDASFDRTAGALSGTYAITGAKAAILPGLCAVWTGYETVNTVGGSAIGDHAWATTTYDFRIAGLFAQFVGGELSDIPSDFAQVGVWRGVNSVYEILAPSFDDTNLNADGSAIDGTAAKEVYMAPNANSQLVAQTPGAFVSPTPPARLLNRLSSEACIVELLV